MPCIDGVPQEFAMQDAFALATKARFPGTRMLLYRITDAVPYDAVVHDAMVEHPDWFVRWHHAPNNNGSICVVPPEAQTGRPGDNCSWPIQAAGESIKTSPETAPPPTHPNLELNFDTPRQPRLPHDLTINTQRTTGIIASCATSSWTRSSSPS